MARMARFLTYGTKGKKKKSLSVNVFLFSLLRHNPKKRAIRAIYTSAPTTKTPQAMPPWQKTNRPQWTLAPP
jgi:hypothetical protein